MVSPVVGVRITGAKDARGKVHIFSNRVLQNIKKKADTRAEQTIFRFNQEIAREYKSQWATGGLAHVTSKSVIKDNGVEIQFFIPNRRELRYVTSLLGGHFQKFPVGKFFISPVRAKFLRIPFPTGLARRFIRGAKGQFAGSQATLEDDEPGSGAILVRRVLWGKKTGGFKRDVIREVAQEEGALFVRDMQAAVKGSIVEMTS